MTSQMKEQLCRDALVYGAGLRRRPEPVEEQICYLSYSKLVIIDKDFEDFLLSTVLNPV